MTLHASQTTVSNPRAVKPAALMILLALTLVCALFFPAGGHLLIDEGIYHMMVRSFGSNGSPSVWNGYEEFPTPELSFPLLREHDGRLFSQYPHLSTILATPFYWLAGYQGLTILNALSFIAVVGLTFRLASTLFDDRALALNACLILILSTYAWQYSQAAWPHALAMLFVTGAVYLTVIALRATDTGRSLVLSMAAGLVTGLGLGVRLDIVFALPAVVLPFVFAVPWRPLHAMAVFLGMMPGLAFLAVMNQIKFDTLSPFSYGAMDSGLTSGLTPYLPIAGAGVAVISAAWLATRPRGQAWLASHRGKAGLGLAVLVIALGLTPYGWQFMAKLGHGLYQLVVDMRVRDLTSVGPGLTRSPTGGMIYLDSLKKALLQSCPYLVVLLVPLAAFVQRRGERPTLGILLLVPPAYVVVYSYLAWHGGLAFHLRYFLPIFPFTSVLTAYAWRELAQELSPRWLRLVAIAGLVVAAIYLFLIAGQNLSLPQEEIVYLTVPMALATTTLVFAGAYLYRGREVRVALRGATAAALVVGLVWAGMVAFTHDAPRSYAWRQLRGDLVRDLATHIEPDSIVLAAVNDDIWGLLEVRRVRLATPSYDGYEDFRPLVHHHLEAGRPVYLWLYPEFTAAIEERNLLEALQTETLYRHILGVLMRVSAPRSKPSPAPPSG